MTRYWRKTNRRTHIILVAGLLFALAALAALMAMSSTGSAAQSSAPSAPTTSFDANMQPRNVLPVIVVSGTPYEVGVQYGQQAKDLIAHNTCVARARALAQYHTWAAVVAAMQSDISEVASKTPEVIKTWQGIADGAGLSLNEIALINVSLQTPGCSTINAWGAATKGDSLIAGANLDAPWLAGNMYGCVLVVYPDQGNSYIDTPIGAGAMSAGRGMNSKGLLILGSGGQASRPEDRGPGFLSFVAVGYAMQHCDTAVQARDFLLSLHLGGASLQNIADTSGHAFVIEQTAAAYAVRKSGDFGEKNYLMGGNFFETKTMRPANDPNQLQFGDLDDWYRYYTEEKLVNENYGKLTVGSLMAILGCHDYYGTRDPVTGAVDTTKPQTWHRDVLSTKPSSDERSIWTPGMRGISWNPPQRTIYEPAQKTMYIMTGNDDPLFAWTPNTTGEFCKLVLADNPADLAAQALADAQLQTWYGAVALHRSGHPTAARLAELNEAKAAVAKGMNLRALAGIATNANQMQLLLGQATTCFCQAQCYAEQAQGIVSNSGTVPPSS